MDFINRSKNDKKMINENAAKDLAIIDSLVMNTYISVIINADITIWQITRATILPFVSFVTKSFPST